MGGCAALGFRGLAVWAAMKRREGGRREKGGGPSAGPLGVGGWAENVDVAMEDKKGLLDPEGTCEWGPKKSGEPLPGSYKFLLDR